MFEHYLKTGLRSLGRKKGYTLINVLGLALGIACCGLIALYVQDERAYDRYHGDADRIYRIIRQWEQGVNGQPPLALATTAPPIVPLLREQFPQIRDGFRLVRGGQTAVRYGDQEFREERVFFAEPSIFDVFSVPLLEGDPRTALTAPQTIVLSERMAHKYFGDRSPVGATLTLDGEDDYRVTGVMADTPARSHVHFDFLISFETLSQWPAFLANWNNNAVYTYVRLTPEDAARVDALEAQFAAFMDRHEPEGNETVLRLQPLEDIHLHSNLPNELEPNGSAATVRTFTLIAVLVLLIAGMNFVNLTTARSAERAREVGVRKALGAQRGQLGRQFLTESLLLACGAFLLGLLLLLVMLPFFRSVSGKAVGLESSPMFLPGVALLTLITGVLAGSYPAFVLSGFQPLQTLRGRFTASSGGALLRKGLVVFQFAASVALMIGTAVVYQQLDYLRSKDLGFDQERVLSVELSDAAQIDLGDALAAAFARIPAVEGVTFTSASLPGSLGSRLSFWREGTERNESNGVNHRVVSAGDHFPGVLGSEMVAGRFFSEAFASDTAGIVINETAARRLGFTHPADAVDQVIEPSLDAVDTFGPQRTIIGVMQDVHLTSLDEEIPPVAFIYNPDPMWNLLVRLQPGDPSVALADLRAAWSGVIGDRPLEYAFVDASFDALYDAQERTGRLLTGFSLLAIAIACLGLFGLAAFTAAQRTKEVGVRKVLGATVPGIVALLSRDFLKLVVAGFVVAAPIAYVAMSRWLQAFAYRIDLGPGTFVLAGLVALAIALLTVSYHAVRAASADPVKSLRYE